MSAPVDLGSMYRPDETDTYHYIMYDYKKDGTNPVRGELRNAFYSENNTDETSYWYANVYFHPNRITNVTITGEPEPAYQYDEIGVDMGLPSGTIWARYNPGSRTQLEAGQHWYDKSGNIVDNIFDRRYDRGDYYAWAELETKYEKPYLWFQGTGASYSENPIIATGYDYNKADNPTGVKGFADYNTKGYYSAAYVDRNFTIARFEGNISGTERDVVRNKLWKGKWRLPTEMEYDELFRNSKVSIETIYYEDNSRYAQWISDKSNQHLYNSEFYGNENQRAFRNRVVVFKIQSKINDAILYLPGGSWSEWSIDMLNCFQRNGYGVYKDTLDFVNHIKNTGQYLPDSVQFNEGYGGAYYLTGSASLVGKSNSCQMQLFCPEFVDGRTEAVLKMWYKNQVYTLTNPIPEGAIVGIHGNGRRYSAMQVRPVYTEKRFNTSAESCSRNVQVE